MTVPETTPLTVRDQFAMAALPGILARGAMPWVAVRQAYECADYALKYRYAMMAQRALGEGGE